MRDALLVGGAVLILVLAAVGLISSAMVLGGIVNASSSPTATPRPTAVPVARILAEAHATATAIVRRADQDASARAHKQDKGAKRTAQQIIGRAQSRARQIIREGQNNARRVQAAAQARAQSTISARVAQAQLPQPNPQPYVAPTATPIVIVPTAPPAAPYPTFTPVTAGSTIGNAVPPPGPTPNYGSVPPTWLVVAYGADLSAFTVTVTNRSAQSFSGNVTVTYLGVGGTDVGEAHAAFTGLPPHSTSVIPLTGPRYPTNAVTYRLAVSNVH